jgi:hypothetical protein
MVVAMVLVSGIPNKITYYTNLTAAVMALSGNNDVVGQNITFIIKRGGVQLRNLMKIIFNSSGVFSQSAPVVIF